MEQGFTGEGVRCKAGDATHANSPKVIERISATLTSYTDMIMTRNTKSSKVKDYCLSAKADNPVDGLDLQAIHRQKRKSVFHRQRRVIEVMTTKIRMPSWWPTGLPALLVMSVLPATLHGQYAFTTNTDNTLTLIRYACGGRAVVIPDSTNGLPITRIGDQAFMTCFDLPSITLGSNVTSVGAFAFESDGNLTNVALPKSLATIGANAFAECRSLTNLTIPDSVTNIEEGAFMWCRALTGVNIPHSMNNLAYNTFAGCISLTTITIPGGITNIGNFAFQFCSALKGVYFAGNAPSLGGELVFNMATNATVYYLPGTSGWGSTFGGRPTALWVLPNPQVLTTAPDFGVHNNQFGFRISWATNVAVVVEASTTLDAWLPVSTSALTSGWSYFSDPQWTNYSSRFYRIRSP